MGCVQLASGGDEEGRSASGRPDSRGGEETVEKRGCLVVSLRQNRGRNGGLVHGAKGRKERRGRTRRRGRDMWRRGGPDGRQDT
jgi:hypothetical protein